MRLDRSGRRGISSRSVRRRHALLLLAACASAAAALGGATTSGATPMQASTGSFEAVASADGLRFEVRTPNFLVANLFDGGAPVAQASMNSLGGSQGFASMPYPGDSVTTLPGLLLPLLGLPALPPYPLVASSIHPSTPESSVGAGVYALTSRSDDRRSAASVRAGVDASGTQSASLQTTAQVDLDEGLGEVAALARSELSGVAVAGVIGVGRVVSSASVVWDGAETDVQASFEVEGLTVAGLRVAVGTAGVEVLGNDVPGLLDVDVVETILAAARVTMEFLPEQQIEGGIISAGLILTMPAPLDPPYDGTVSLTLGRSRAVVDAAPTRPAPRPSDALDAPASTPSSSSSTGGVAAPVIPSTGGAGQAAPFQSPVVASPSASPAEGLRIVALDESTASFYLVLVLGSLVLLVGMVLFRYFGVKLAWSS